MHEAGLAHHDFSASSIVIGYDAGDMPYATLLDGDSGQLHEAGEGAASDMHALGAVLWRAITGSRFERVSPDDEGAPDPRRVRSELPGGLAEMVSQLLSPQEDERPTAAEFVAAWPSLVATFESVPSESSSEPESPEPASPQFLPPTLSDAPTLRSGIVLPLITGKTVTVPAITDDEEPPVPPTTGKKGPKPPSISDKKAPAPPVVTAKRSPTPPVITGRTVMTPAAAAGEIHTPSSSFQPPSRPTNGGSNLRAVVVESNPFTRRLLERRLQRAGVSVTLVSDVGQISAEHRPDLAFVRAEFDGPDPYGIVEQVRAEVPGLPVVLTAPPDTEVGEAWRGRDVLDVLVAPSEFDRLAPLLARMRAP
jgi:CheY-like chemotaxis protein